MFSLSGEHLMPAFLLLSALLGLRGVAWYLPPVSACYLCVCVCACARVHVHACRYVCACFLLLKHANHVALGAHPHLNL